MSYRAFRDAVIHPRDIIDRRRTLAALADLPGGEGEKAVALRRTGVLAVLKQTLADGRAEVRRRFEAGAPALEVLRAHAFLIDQILRIAFDDTIAHVYRRSNPTAGERLSLVAIGGYGRGELAPHSDIDLLFLFPYKQTPWGEQVAEHILYLLWDLGLKVGHATRSIDDCIRLSKGDITIRTSLLEARWIWGERDLYDQLRDRFRKEVVAKTGAEFIDKKLAERDERHRRIGDTRYLVEPNIKDGKGGLRDLHTLFWIAKYLYQVDQVEELADIGVLTPDEYRRFNRAQTFLWTVRIHLHYLANRPEERLTFDVQPELARRLGYVDRPGHRDVERFMKHYYLVAKDVGDLTRIFCAALEDKHKKKPPLPLALPRLMRRRRIDGFIIDGGRVTVGSAGLFAEQPVKMLRLFHLAQEREVDIHPDALRLVQRNLKRIDATLREDPEANRLFLEMLTSKNDPETTLRRMNEAGVFGRFIPDFGRVVAQTQHDMYHVYTVDEHTIRAIGILWKIEQGKLAEDHPLSHEIIHKVLSRRVLYMAVLLHDIAKGRGGDHSVLGEKVAQKLCPRVGLSPAETETVAWLVLHHLAMSATSFKRDINDFKTVLDFAGFVQSPERLRLLLVLTVADIRAVGPTVWNGWKGQLLRELYHRAEDVLSGGHATDGRQRRIDAAKADIAAGLPDWPAAEVAELVKRHYDNYWLTYSADTHVRHARLMRQADREQRQLTVETRSDKFRAVTELTLYAPDHPGLFARVAGAIATCGGNIVDAQVYTTADGMALDTFVIQDMEGNAFDRPERLAKLSAAIAATLAGELRPMTALPDERPGIPSRARVFQVAPVVLIDNNASNRFTVIEVNGRDRPGFLYDVSRALYRLNLSIGSAHVATYGERAVDVFYVRDLTGMKVTRKDRLAVIERELLAAIQPPDAREQADRKRSPTKAQPRRGAAAE